MFTRKQLLNVLIYPSNLTWEKADIFIKSQNSSF